jgi:hypothetical protein
MLFANQNIGKKYFLQLFAAGLRLFNNSHTMICFFYYKQFIM